ncbi:MAG: hypothetical protein WCJ64_12560 [Rhodospirillaceae bacterium]
MASADGKNSKLIAMIVLAVAFVGLVVWKFSAFRDYNFGLLSNEAVVPMPEYYVADARKIVDIASSNRASFTQLYARQSFSGDLVFVGVEGRGGASVLLRMKTAADKGIAVTCAMNKFQAETHKDTIASLKNGAAVRVKGPIGSDTGAQGIALSDGCLVEPSYAQPAAK